MIVIHASSKLHLPVLHMNCKCSTLANLVAISLLHALLFEWTLYDFITLLKASHLQRSNIVGVILSNNVIVCNLSVLKQEAGPNSSMLFDRCNNKCIFGLLSMSGMWTFNSFTNSLLSASTHEWFGWNGLQYVIINICGKGLSFPTECEINYIPWTRKATVLFCRHWIWNTLLQKKICDW